MAPWLTACDCRLWPQVRLEAGLGDARKELRIKSFLRDWGEDGPVVHAATLAKVRFTRHIGVLCRAVLSCLGRCVPVGVCTWRPGSRTSTPARTVSRPCPCRGAPPLDSPLVRRRRAVPVHRTRLSR